MKPLDYLVWASGLTGAALAFIISMLLDTWVGDMAGAWILALGAGATIMAQLMVKLYKESEDANG